MPPLGEEWRIERLEEGFERHEKDLYRGNGKPGLTTRMQKAEDSLESMKYYFRAIIGILLGLLAKSFWPHQ